ncbi:hypothetical protein DCS_04245 [Drechmeria coniospora]|uniref:Uncharacterized protein n=1 Tax=Drechmeria coniospora TaxID=98403 RepID=A0A151GJH8_DRECN|nr:hypothetical protein DCS_04245 [Drechmeria coniospora]KYK57238.1 hypothetical protein DCS_04245 [Drechmeria coniospora]
MQLGITSGLPALVILLQWLGNSSAAPPSPEAALVRRVGENIDAGAKSPDTHLSSSLDSDPDDPMEQILREMQENRKNSMHFPGTSREQPGLLFRVDGRSPGEIFEHGMTNPLNGEPVMPHTFDAGRHTAQVGDTNFLSLTRSPAVAESFGKDVMPGGHRNFFGADDWAKVQAHSEKTTGNPVWFDGAPPKAASLTPVETPKQWIYLVQANKKYLNLFQILGPDGFAAREFVAQQEFVVVGGRIEADRIIGAYQLGDSQKMVILNKNYNHAYDGQRASNGLTEFAHEGNAALAEKIIKEADGESEQLKKESGGRSRQKFTKSRLPLSEVIKQFNANTPQQANNKDVKGKASDRNGASTSKSMCARDGNCKYGKAELIRLPESDGSESGKEKQPEGNLQPDESKKATKNQSPEQHRLPGYNKKAALIQHLGGCILGLASNAIYYEAQKNSVSPCPMLIIYFVLVRFWGKLVTRDLFQWIQFGTKGGKRGCP